jgi:hypothetical protein
MQAATIRSRSSLFLIEMIWVILFFALGGAVCARLFAYAHTTSLDSRDLSRAVVEAGNAAACVRACGDDRQAYAELVGAVPDADGKLTVYYDDRWNPQSAPNGWRYKMSLALSGTPGGMVRCKITVSGHRGGLEKTIYSLQTQIYAPTV